MFRESSFLEAMVISSVRMGEVDKRDAAVAELLSSEASYVSDLKVRP